jgi:exodeoxyribonuclease V beta subunit
MSIDNNLNSFDASTVALESSNLIEASAGTGKTYSIAILTLRLVLEKKLAIQQILMVTFTKAAVAELETRIRQFMRNALKASQGIAIGDETISQIVNASMADTANGPEETERLLKEAVLFLDETAILTIHSFCQRVLTEFAFETSQIFGSEILMDIKSIITDQVNVFWRKYITTLHTGLLRELIRSGISRDNLVGLMENALGGKAITPNEILPNEFLSAQYQTDLFATIVEQESRINQASQDLIQYISTNIDAIKLATEKNAYASKNFRQYLNDPQAFLNAIVEKKDLANVKKAYADILVEYEKIALIEAEKSALLNTLINQLYVLAIEIITAETKRIKQQNNQLSFDDMINKLHKAIAVDNNTFLINSLKTKYKAAFIDEFQDTDKVQYEIFNRLFAEDAVLFYIGDPKQSIYAWRKADIFTYFKAGDAVANKFGMNTNYRSSNVFIAGMNQFFLPTPNFDTFYFFGMANSFGYINVEPPAQSSKGELLKGGKLELPITIFENSNNDSIIETVAAQVVQLLSKDNFSIEAKGEKRNIRPSDIGILVRRNDQGASIKQLLSGLGIPAVTIDDTKLFQSAEAVSLLYLLAAVIDINASSINKALLSPLTGFTANDILAMDDELALSRFKNYQHLWEHEGVYVMLTKFIADYKVKQVLLEGETENGERIITNTLQLMEVLHKIQTQKQFSSLELTNWLKRGIEGMEVEGDEFEQRVESDEEAVKIVTIHKSKGLEYNIVFAPFLDMLAEPKAGFVTFRDADTGAYLFSDKAMLDDHRLQITKTQLEQENRRLIYVAVTRAVYKCYINKNTNGRYRESSIAPFVNAAKENPSPLIAFEASPELPVKYKYSDNAGHLKPAYLTAEHFQLTEVNWRKLSYTYLDAGGHTTSLKSNVAKGLNSYDEFIFKQLNRGANTGNLLHHIFERIDFTDDTRWGNIIEAAMNRFMPNSLADYAAQLLELLHHVTETSITVGDTAFSLNQLPIHKKLNELEFDFNVLPFVPDAINQLSNVEVPIQIRYAKELEGIMNGKIDLFFEHGGKYFILDWKSNYLGDRPADYSKENVALAMAESNYHLQYLIYTVAVKKYLALRVPGFDYATHFGGVIYLFVRGIRRDNELGVFTSCPEEHLIVKLEKMFSLQTAESI